MNKDFYEVILVDDKSIEEYEDILEDYKHDMNIVFIKNTTKYNYSINLLGLQHFLQKL